MMIRKSRKKINKSRIILDIETTGLSAESDDIIEISAIRIDGRYNIQNEFHCFLKPRCKLSSLIKDLTGLTDNDLKDCVEFKDVKAEFLMFLGNDEIYAYGDLDRRFLKNNCYINNTFVDVLAIVRKRCTQIQKFSFKNVCANYSIKNLKPHSGTYDTIALIQLMERLKI